MSNILTISLSPHIHTRLSVSRCMWTVVAALIPAWLCGLVMFGTDVLTVTAVSIAACVAFEYAITRWMLRRPVRTADGSAALTGLLLAMNLPSGLDWWIVVIGAFAAIAIAKMSFGGLGCNIFNPALVGRVFLLVSFPAQMTRWPLPMQWWHTADATTGATTGATALSVLKESGHAAGTLGDASLWNGFLGDVGGSLGEVSAVALLGGFVILLVCRVITWHIPVAVFAGVTVMSLCAGADPIVEILSGGLILGAVFMATDYVTSPMTRAGMLLYGFMIGIITCIIRFWGSYPEGVSFAILIMNGCVPLIDRWITPRRFGATKPRP